jgi:hypothetical protein
MGGVLQQVKENVKVIIQRVERILTEQKVNASSQMQIMVYRNYDRPPNLALEYSKFTSDSTDLTSWIETKQAYGGWGDKEAVELAYNKVGMTEGVNQVILIGDAPANTPQNIKYKRGTTQFRKEY